MDAVLVTGGAGFIGSCFVRQMVKERPQHHYVVLDKLTYAGNVENIAEVAKKITFVHGDIADSVVLEKIFQQHKIRWVVNFAAETHVDRSIGSPEDFIVTDILGTYRLLEASKKYKVDLFIQISTDEVYGQVLSGHSTEQDPLMARNPYSASKAGADRLAYSYFATYGLPVIITRCSNNYGPYQHPEKLIPLFVTNLLEGKKVPLYGDGKNVRDWIHVEDHVRAIAFLWDKGILGEVYNIGGGEERCNLEITQIILSELGKSQDDIQYVADRKGHDRRYALDASKIAALGFKPKARFEESIRATIRWYCEHPEWWQKIKSGAFQSYYQKMYSNT